jgi:uncharacterized protein YndB with AHSA1/START domain
MTPTAEEHAVVRLERTIPAPPHRVYRAWLEPALLARWMGPGSLEVTRVEVDERIGGHYRIWQADSGAIVGGFGCEVLELVTDQRIVLRWGFVGPERTDGPIYDSLLTITLHEAREGATTLVLLHERLDELAAAMPHVAQNVDPGWQDALGKLVATLETSAR